jgi:hypothetical protein
VAFQLTKAELKERDEMVASVKEKQTALNTAIEEYNETVNEAWGKLEDYVNEFNGALSDLRDFVEQAKDRLTGEYDDKSEKWMEGEKGTAVRIWIDTFGSIMIDDFDPDPPSEVDRLDDIEGLDEVENLETEPNY